MKEGDIIEIQTIDRRGLMLIDEEVDIQSAIGREHYCRTHLKDYKDGEKALAGERQVANAQNTKTLMAVGEWLENTCNISGGVWVIAERFKTYVKAFKRGEIPE